VSSRGWNPRKESEKTVPALKGPDCKSAVPRGGTAATHGRPLRGLWIPARKDFDATLLYFTR